MAENSKIEWTDHTFNPWIGCVKVSPGCDHCYAETLMDTRYGRVKWGVNGTRMRTSEANWRKPVSWNREAGKQGVRTRVFCASLADVFEDREELIPWRQQLFHLIGQTPHLDWLVLTKRPENVLHFGFQQQLWWPNESFPHNVWIGTSVEDQRRADKRIPHLLRIPASIRFLSMEPLLGAVNLAEPGHLNCYGMAGNIGKVNWVIVGGESGQGARPMHPAWAQSIRDQCQAASVPFFFKQWGEWSPGAFGGIHSKKPAIYLTCDGLQSDDHSRWGREDNPQLMTMVGKAPAGRMLDGREWSEFPAGGSR